MLSDSNFLVFSSVIIILKVQFIKILVQYFAAKINSIYGGRLVHLSSFSWNVNLRIWGLRERAENSSA